MIKIPIKRLRFTQSQVNDKILFILYYNLDFIISSTTIDIDGKFWHGTSSIRMPYNFKSTNK